MANIQNGTFRFIYSISSDLVERNNQSQFKTFWNNDNCNVAFMLNLFAAYKCKKNFQLKECKKRVSQ